MLIYFLFWLAIGITLYTYFGYIMLLWLPCTIKRKRRNITAMNQNQLPDVTIIIAAHNEERYIIPKYQNTLSLNYPSQKVHQVWVTDGNTDNTSEILKSLQNITLINSPQRLGKALSINKAMELVKTPITLYTDANTYLSPNSLVDLVKLFENPKVGCVAGQKKIRCDDTDGLASKGEGIYWRYESLIKKLESCTGSTVSGAGELYAIRTNLFKPLPGNTILDDFEISANIIYQGYRIKYVHQAIASEAGSLTVDDEKKRKVRIAAGCFQALVRHINLLNPIKNAEIAFKFFSHKVLRWIFVPPIIIAIPFLNAIILFLNQSNSITYTLTFAAISFFYGMVAIGYLIRHSARLSSWVTFPYYGFMMNINMLKGFIRFTMGKQSHIWDKAKRKTDI